jgi:hypothetical protein
MRKRAAVVLALVSCGGSAGDPGPDANDSTGEILTATFGPISVPAGVEDTRCVEVRLPNAEHKWIGKIHTQLIGVSHHLIVYRVPDGEERTEPFPCTPFIETLSPESSGVPLVVTQVARETLDLPYGVAFDLQPSQLIRLEMHYVNPSDVDDTVQAIVQFEVLPEEQFENEADFLFIGNPDITLPPGPSTLGPTWFALPWDLADVKIFAMTGHTHHWGTNVVVERLSGETAEPESVYDYPQWDWEEPPTARFSPQLAMPAGSGFRFTCSWDNRAEPPQTISFGESSEDEMCFFWAYYYPSHGHKVCVHTEQLGAPIDVCCPGDSICRLIDQFSP